MNKKILLLILLFIYTHISCKKENPTYNQKANQVIQQIILDDSCSCLLEITNQSLIGISLNDNPRYDIKKWLIENLQLKSQKELDNLDVNNEKIDLDMTFLKDKNIQLIKRENLQDKIRDQSLFTSCPEEILVLSKPLFNKQYTIAIVNYGYVGSHIGLPPMVYHFKNEKWIRT